MAFLNEGINVRKHAAFIFGSESSVCRQVIHDLKEKDWYVYEEERKDCTKGRIIRRAEDIQNSISYLDMLVLGNDEELFSRDLLQNESLWKKAKEKYDQSINLNLLLIHHLLPLLDAGDMKRICYVNTRDSSNNLCCDSHYDLNHIIGAASNMQAAILKNRLEPEGYTFRIFSYNKERETKKKGSFVTDYFILNRSLDPNSSLHSDEKRLVMRDEEGRELPW